MAKKTYECEACHAIFQIDEKEKGPRCTVCGKAAVIEIGEEALQDLLNPRQCGFR